MKPQMLLSKGINERFEQEDLSLVCSIEIFLLTSIVEVSSG